MSEGQTPTIFDQPIAFKAETRQLLDILIHSLYTEREIFLREMISNASDALTRVDFEILTNRDVFDPQAALEIRIIPNKEEGTLTIEDSGIGMTAEELATNLGTIAQSGVREFLAAAKAAGKAATDLIGQFGVGFYSAFMVADWIRVVSRSYRPEATAAEWFCAGADTFTIRAANRTKRGTAVVIKLKEDAREFLEEYRLREVIRKHSDFIPFPIYIGDQKEQVNRQTAIWRQNPREVTEKDYNDFYQQLTLDFQPPLLHTHMVVDAPVQLYALLYVPASPERPIFSPRREQGLKLYARKVLIQEYNRDLLPEYLEFVQGVVDSEDLPLNVSREAVQSTRVMAQLKKLVTSKVLDTLKELAEKEKEKYATFWKNFGRYIKQGVALESTETEALYALLRFHTSLHPEEWSSLEDYLARMKPEQKAIYYIMGDDEASVRFSPHLDVMRHYGYEVLLLADPVDVFMLTRLKEYQGHPLENVATADLTIPAKEAESEGKTSSREETTEINALLERIKKQLQDKVSDVRLTKRLSDSPARLVDAQGSMNQEMQRIYRLLERDFQIPKKVLEINPGHPIIQRLASLPPEAELGNLVIEQIYEDALLIEGLHPNPASMIQRIQRLMEAALL